MTAAPCRCDGGSYETKEHPFLVHPDCQVHQPPAGHEHPMPGNVLQTVVELDHYQGPSGRYDTEDIDAAQVVTSMVAATWDPTEGNSAQPMHRPVLDIDFPAQLIPSSTPGHFHLYLDREIEHKKYLRLLDALVECGLIEEGYCNASQDRGYTAVRLPWVKKPETAEAP